MNTPDLIQELFIKEVLQDSSSEIDLNALCMYPNTLISLSEKIGTLLDSFYFHFICPINTSSIPLATAIAITKQISMLPFCSQNLEMLIHEGQTAVLFDASNFSLPRIISCQKKLHSLNVCVSHAIVLIENRHEKKEENFNPNIEIHSLWDLKKIQNSYSKIHSSDIS